MADRSTRRKRSIQQASVWAALSLGSILIIVGASFLSENVAVGNVRAYLAQAAGIGMNAAVLPNESNTIALQLEQKDSRLKAQAAELDERERAFEAQRLSEQKLAPWFILGGSILLGLVLLNFYLDYRRRTMSLAR